MRDEKIGCWRLGYHRGKLNTLCKENAFSFPTLLIMKMEQKSVHITQPCFPPQTSLAQRKARSTSMTAAGESLRAYVIKMLRQVEESRGDGSEREGRRHYVGEGLSDRISLQTSCSIYRSEEERDPHMCNPSFS